MQHLYAEFPICRSALALLTMPLAVVQTALKPAFSMAWHCVNVLDVYSTSCTTRELLVGFDKLCPDGRSLLF